MSILAWPFIFLATTGLVISIVVHVFALLGLPIPFPWPTMYLHLGVFLVMLPAIIVSNQSTKDFKRQDLWRTALRGCPHWVKYILKELGGYAIVNFLFFMFLQRGIRPQEIPESWTLRFFSGHWMFFYASALALLYSYNQTQARDLAGAARTVIPYLRRPSIVRCEGSPWWSGLACRTGNHSLILIRIAGNW